MSANSTSRRLNYTSRHRIKRAWVEAAVIQEDDGPVLSASVELGQLPDLPGEAAVFVEAERRTVSVRYGLGTVSTPQPLVGQPLERFSDPDGVLLRFKVVGTGTEDNGRLLAVADKIRPEFADDDNSAGRPLLRFRSDDGIGQVPWMLDFSDDDPVVLMNSKLGDWNKAARTEPFVTLVYPEVLRQIAIWAGKSVADGIEPEGPLADWVQLLAQHGFRVSADGFETRDIEEAAAAAAMSFANSHKLTDRASSILVAEAD